MEDTQHKLESKLKQSVIESKGVEVSWVSGCIFIFNLVTRGYHLGFIPVVWPELVQISTFDCLMLLKIGGYAQHLGPIM